jgi:hypothetical protein
MGWVRWPADAPGNPAILGGKGTALWALLRHGYPVPPAFALPVEACQLWRQAGQPDTLPGAVQTALAEAVARLQALAGGAPRLAVRSSVVAEDSALASFAGQLSTQLNVVAEHVAAAVPSVWRSADTTHVATYRQRLGSEAGCGWAAVARGDRSARIRSTRRGECESGHAPGAHGANDHRQWRHGRSVGSMKFSTRAREGKSGAGVVS